MNIDRGKGALSWLSRTFLVAAISLCVKHCAAADKQADAMWSDLQSIAEVPLDQRQEFRNLEEECLNIKYRELGLKFYYAFPEDSRRWDWLVRTIVCRPGYFTDPDAAIRHNKLATDQVPAENWQTLFENQLKPAFLASRQVTDVQREQVLSAEVTKLLTDLQISERRFWKQHPGMIHNNTEGAQLFAKAILEYGKEPLAKPERITDFMRTFFSYIDRGNVTAEVYDSIVETLCGSGNMDIRGYGLGKKQQRILRSSPLDLKLSAFDGPEIDLLRLRGRPVLVDIWNVGCSSCIAAMPTLKIIYDKYHAQGLEILGICSLLNPKIESTEITQARAILRRTGAAEWYNGYIGGSACKEFWKKYSIVYNPETWLLDKDGKLAKHISVEDVRGAGLEEEVRRVIGLAPLPASGGVESTSSSRATAGGSPDSN